MKLRRLFCCVGLVSVAAATTMAINESRPTSAQEAREAFLNPLPTYSTGPLWVWNDLLTDEQITSTLQDMASQNVKMVFVHPRPGLVTPYLSEEWFRLWEVTMAEADRLGMKVWIYDENSYPSGFAGGHVPEEMPDGEQRGMIFREEPLPSPVTTHTLAVFRLEGGEAEDVTKKVQEGAEFTTGTYLTVFTEGQAPHPWYGMRTYVDLLNRKVTDKFLEVTLEPYQKRFGERFGKSILGSFTDEPNVRVRETAWTPKLFDEFEKRWGYDLKPHLASLSRPVGDWKQVRHNYWQLVNELFTRNWAKPYYDYCQKNNLELTGHFWDHEWPNIGGVPDNMAMYYWQQRPAIDCLMNNYAEHTHGQFGNARMGRELASVANQMGRKRTLCESFGAAGWDFRFEDMKRIGDWLAVLGVNTFNEHLSYVTIRGARKRDHPQSFSYHTPWWPDYHVVANYLSRLSAAISQGEQVNDIVLLQPTTTAYMYQTKCEPPDQLKKLGDSFQNLHIALERAQVEYDMLSEYVLEEKGKSRGPKLQVGDRRYSTVIIPPMTENLNERTVKFLEDLVWEGGRVICCGETPSFVDGKKDSRLLNAAGSDGWLELSPEEAVAKLREESGRDFRIEWTRENNGILFHQRRRLTDGELLFLVNTSADQPARGSWSSASAKAAELWDLESGEIKPAAGVKAGAEGGIQGSFSLPPCGSLLLVLKPEGELAAEAKETTRAIAASGEPVIRRTEPNVLTLDFLDLKVGDESTTGQYFFRAAQKVFRAMGLKDNPWERAVQFKDEILKAEVRKDASFAATYRFTVRDEAPEELFVVVERPDLYSRISCNDQPLSVSKDWWLDKSFLKLDLSKAVRQGENRITLEAGPLGVFHELEPVYLVGNFRLRSAGNGFDLEKESPLKLGAWSEQGHPFYASGVSYKQAFEVERPKGKYRLQLPKWLGSVARVRVNGKEAGHVAWAPWECDVTEAIQPGKNEVEVVVVGTLKNTLGPHHTGTLRGSAWPVNFQAAPESGPPAGEKYDVIGYGLFEPFQLVEVAGEGG